MQYLPMIAITWGLFPYFWSNFTPSFQMPLVKVIETICGIALLTNRFTAEGILRV